MKLEGPIYLRQSLSQDTTKQGKISGVSYSGGIIPQYMFWENFIVDISTLEVVKEKTPIFRDHDPSRVAGHGKVTIENNTISIEGILSKNTPHGSEIISLAEEGFDWEQSIGVFDGVIDEVTSEEVNGIMVEHGFVLRNGKLREVSVVALGADINTNATILSKSKGDQKMLTKEQWIKFACACGGDKDTTPAELEEKIKKTKLETEEQAEKVEELEKEVEVLEEKVEELEEEIDKKEAEIEAIKEEGAVDEREIEIAMAAKKAGVKLSSEKVSEAAKSKETTKALLSFISDVKVEVKKDPTLFKKETVGGKVNSEIKDITLKARQMVKDGEAKDLVEAYAKMEVQ